MKMNKPKIYNINSAKIGNQKGFRLPNAFYKDNPHFSDTSGQIEVIDEQTLLIRLDTKEEIEEENDESVMMSLFLNFLMKDAVTSPEKLIPYTEQMSDEIDQLLVDVILEEE